jgi:hypothetical protein
MFYLKNFIDLNRLLWDFSRINGILKEFYRFISKFLFFNKLLWGLIWKNVKFKEFYGFKSVIMGFFMN